jgi:hypothetical protein
MALADLLVELLVESDSTLVDACNEALIKNNMLPLSNNREVIAIAFDPSIPESVKIQTGRALEKAYKAKKLATDEEGRFYTPSMVEEYGGYITKELVKQAERALKKAGNIKPTKKQTPYDKLEGKVLDAIDSVFKNNWWMHLSSETQEAIHDSLFKVLK